MPYDRQVIIQIKTTSDYDTVTNGAAALKSKAEGQKECKSIEVELDPGHKGAGGRLIMPENWQAAVDWLKVPDATYNRIYILTHGSDVSPGTLQGLNAGEVADILRPFKGYVSKIILVVCKGGNTAEGGVNFAQQLAALLIGFNATVSAYKVPVAIWTQQLIEKYGHLGPQCGPQSLGKKFVDVKGQATFIRDYSSGIETRQDVKAQFPTRSA